MNLFRWCSAISVACTALICVYVVPSILVQGQVDVDAGFQLFVIYPTLVAVPVSLVGALFGLSGLFGLRASEYRRNVPFVIAVAGQVVTWVGIAAVIVWAVGYGSTGWELLMLPFSLVVGQVIVGVALVILLRRDSGRAGVVAGP